MLCLAWQAKLDNNLSAQFRQKINTVAATVDVDELCLVLESCCQSCLVFVWSWQRSAQLQGALS